ncbi:DUF2066 domain-containing protein [Ferrimonas gelatinilytica]|uniref:DUF2066 domain-containing protein n=1 Tax=Ferrimonas gelatinilytica TaxID=1255257 RepID=A0ABP9S2J2_9GAMM
MRTFLFLLAFCLSAGARAVTVEDLYRGQVPVDSRSAQERQQGVRAALAQVIVRVTGDEALLADESVRSVLGRADRFLLSFGYGEAGMLQVDFDGERIRQALQAAELPLWGAQRPQTLVWLAGAGDGAPQLLGESDEWANPLSNSGERRGVPVLLPILDLEDSLAVEVNDVWGGFPSKVLEASTRYGSDFVASVRLEQSQGQWQYALALYELRSEAVIPRPVFRDRGQGETPEAALDALVATLAKYYAGRYAAVFSGSADTAQLRFEIPKGLAPLIALERYLESLTPVRSVTIVEVGQGEVQFSLELVGGIAEVEQLMGLNPAITALPSEEPLPAAPRYRWSMR